MKVPQANDITKIIDIPLAVANGSHNLNAIVQRYSFDRRQASYYLEATEMLGLIARDKDRYKLTNLGQKYVALDYPERRELLARNMLGLPIIAAVVIELIVSRNHSVSRRRLEEVTRVGGRISGTTVGRRAQTLFKWLEWLAKETGAFKVSRDAFMLRTRQ